MGPSERTIWEEDKPPRPFRLLHSERGAEVLERDLLLAFVIVAALCVLWNLSSGLHWLWTNCASQFHSALLGLMQPSV